MPTHPRANQDTPAGAPPSTPVADALFAPLRDALKPAYLLQRRLGEGGMGAVYVAREPALKRDVAVKVMLPWLAKDPTARARFDREAQAVAAITHPHVINIFGTGELADGTPYFVMQYVSGRSLEARLAAEGQLGVSEARRILGEVAAALGAAHRRGIVHRDIKPANVIQDAESGRVVVTDFGIAAVRESDADLKLTTPDTGSPGTPLYMAPEQLVGEELTEKSDIYAFGLLAFELLTGAGPFQATSPHEIAAAHLRDTPPPLSRLRPDADPELEHLVAGCLAKKSTERPAAEQVAARLLPGGSMALEWPPPGLERLHGALPRFSRRAGLSSALLAMAVLGLALNEPGTPAAIPPLVFEFSALLGGVLLLQAIAANRLVGDAGRALRRGYEWTTLLEVMADFRGDTGLLIAAQRDFAPLSSVPRQRLRLIRIVAALTAFAAAAAPLPALLVAVRLGAAGAIGPLGAATLTMMPSLLLLAVVQSLRLVESRFVKRPRARGAAAAPPVSPLAVQAWNSSLRSAQAALPLPKLLPGPLSTRLLSGAVALAITVAVLAMTPLIALPMLGRVMGAVAEPLYSNAYQRFRAAEVARPWRPAIEAGITPLEAGMALHRLSLPDPRFSDLLQPDPALPEPISIRNISSVLGQLNAARLDSLLVQAARGGLPVRERQAIAQLAAQPGWSLVRAAARAARPDVARTRHTAEALASVPLSELSIPRIMMLRDVGNAAAAVAALRLMDGRTREAESWLRDPIGLGFNVMHYGLSRAETLVGSTILNNGLERLETFYRLTGRAGEADRIRAARDSARNATDRELERQDAARRPQDDLVTRNRRGLIGIIGDSTVPVSFRWSFVSNLTFQQCFNARELVFGPSEATTEVLRRFERQTLEVRGDSLWMRKMLDPPYAGSQGAASWIIGRVGRLVGSRRLAQCGAILSG